MILFPGNAAKESGMRKLEVGIGNEEIGKY